VRSEERRKPVRNGAGLVRRESSTPRRKISAAAQLQGQCILKRGLTRTPTLASLLKPSCPQQNYKITGQNKFLIGWELGYLKECGVEKPGGMGRNQAHLYERIAQSHCKIRNRLKGG